MAIPITKSLDKYLKEVTGEIPHLLSPPKQTVSSLPLFLRTHYRFFLIRLFGRKHLLAIEEQRAHESTPGDYAKHSALLKNHTNEHVILVLRPIPSYVRNRLVQKGVSFIVPGNQMFLPMLMIDLREYYPKSKTHSQTVLSTVPQVVVLYHLLREPLNGISLREISKRLKYSAMALSRAQSELEAKGLCTVKRFGRTFCLEFTDTRARLWQNTKPFLQTPVKRTELIQWGTLQPRPPFAGISALSRLSGIDDDSIPTFAMRHTDLRKAVARSTVRRTEDLHQAEAKIEAWKYDPLLLAEGTTVDRCSLYASLRYSSDERVQKELMNLVTFES